MYIIAIELFTGKNKQVTDLLLGGGGFMRLFVTGEYCWWNPPLQIISFTVVSEWFNLSRTQRTQRKRRERWVIL